MRPEKNALPSCACPDLDALSCYRNRYKLEPGDTDHYFEVACECFCHDEDDEEDVP